MEENPAEQQALNAHYQPILQTKLPPGYYDTMVNAYNFIIHQAQHNAAIRRMTPEQRADFVRNSVCSMFSIRLMEYFRNHPNETDLTPLEIGGLFNSNFYTEIRNSFPDSELINKLAGNNHLGIPQFTQTAWLFVKLLESIQRMPKQPPTVEKRPRQSSASSSVGGKKKLQAKPARK